MIVRVLGSAAGGGVPQWNCRCVNCESARGGTAPVRMQASIAVSADGSAWVLVNATTDVRRQLESLPSTSSGVPRMTPVSAVLLTDANIDDAAGLLDLRQADSLHVISSTRVRDALVGTNSMFEPLARAGRRWSTFDATHDDVEIRDLAAGLRVTAVDVPGLLPSFAGAAELPGAVTAFRFEQSGVPDSARLLYAPVFLRMNDALLAAAESSDAIFLDGSFWTDGELASLGLGTRTAREMGHAPVGGADGWLRAFAAHGTARPHRYCTHVNNSNPLLDRRSAAARELREAAFSVATDGMEIILDGRA
ncbi:MAG TPA: MBL fold metallo-hydrolase [Candidatus Eremiobacteraceae bacterium]|nr:MBL fold metallo-hydrolase [Candidatus Eremiobacteraceae bacterium]